MSEHCLLLAKNIMVVMSNDCSKDNVSIQIENDKFVCSQRKRDVSGLLLCENQLLNSDFSNGFNCWSVQGNSHGQANVGINFQDQWTPFDCSTAYVHTPTLENEVTIVYKDTIDGEYIPISNSSLYRLSAHFGLHRCQATFGIEFYDLKKNLLCSTHEKIEPALGGRSLSDYSDVAIVVTSPLEAVFARIVIIKQPEANDSFVFFLHTWFGLVTNSFDFYWKPSPFTPEALHKIRRNAGVVPVSLMQVIPPKYFDGIPHEVFAIDLENGLHLPGSPAVFCADEAGIEICYVQIMDMAASLRSSGRLDDAAELFGQAATLCEKNQDALVAGLEILLSIGRETDVAKIINRELTRQQNTPELIAIHRKLMARRRAKRVDMIAFYLPQFHITDENNAWWGRGFTEWTNVGNSRALFGEHLQPRRPTALGYYDLRVPEAVNAQFELAQRYGIRAFCYYYYWFDGRKVLDRPLQDLLDGRTGPFPFCLCWANEDWARNWDGLSGEVLLAQKHTPESDLRFMEDIIPILKHESYYRYENKPLLLIYRVNKLSTPKETVDNWRDMCRDAGIGEVYICAVQSFGFDDPIKFGCDAAVEFPPHSIHYKYPQLNYYRDISSTVTNLVEGFTGKIQDYQSFAGAASNRPAETYPLHRGCFLAWDNTPRRDKSAHIFHNYSVNSYRNWLADAAARDAEEHETGLVFINAWNEWAEGATLEPDNYFGFGNLEATRAAQKLAPYMANKTFWLRSEPHLLVDHLELDCRIILVGHDACANGAQVHLLNMAHCLKRELGVGVIFFLLDGGPLLSDHERIGPTIVLGKEDGWKDRLITEARKCYAIGAKKVICNTVVTGHVTETLKKVGFSVISLIHEMPSLIESYNLQECCWKNAEYADYLVFASNVVASNFTDRYWPKTSKVVIAPQGVVFNQYHERRDEIRSDVRKECGFPDESLIVLGCGYGDIRKGVDLFVQMAADVRRRLVGRKVCFIWVGDLEANLSPYIRNDIRRLGLERDLIVTGFTKEFAKYFIASDAFALTSREDPFPSVVLLALEACLPVIAFDGGGGYVDVVNDLTGGLVPHLDTGAMSCKVGEILLDDDKRKKMGQYGHAFCREHFSYASYIRKLLALFVRKPLESIQDGKMVRFGKLGNRPAPKISVIVPNFNYGRYLELRLRSILDQTYAPCEILVLDDASSDYSIDIIESVAKDSIIPIRLVRNDKNTGNTFVQWARGLSIVCGDLIWIAEADDYCEPTLLEKLVCEFVDDSVVLAWCDSVVVNELGSSFGYEYKRGYAVNYGTWWNYSFNIAGKDLRNRCLLFDNVIPNASAALFRRSAVPQDLTTIQKYNFSGDWWFWAEIAEMGRVAYVAESLNYHRRHTRSVMGEVLKDGAKLVHELIAFYQRVYQRWPESITPTVALGMIKKLNIVYNEHSNKSGLCRSILEDESVGSEYAALVEVLNINKVTACLNLRRPASLIFSAEFLKYGNDISIMLDTLCQRYRLNLILLGDEEVAQLAGVGIQDRYESVTWLLPEEDCVKRSVDGASNRPNPKKFGAKRIPRSGLAAELGQFLEKTTQGTLFVYGFLAQKALIDLDPQSGIEWHILAGEEYDAILGGEAPENCTATHLQKAISHCLSLIYICDTLPHIAGQLCEANKKIAESLSFKIGRPSLLSKGLQMSRPLRVVAVASSVPLDTWKEVATLLAPFNLSSKRLMLNLIASGESLTHIQQYLHGIPGVEVHPNSAFDDDSKLIGDIGLDIAEDSLYGSNRTWTKFIEMNMGVIVKVTEDEYRDEAKNYFGIIPVTSTGGIVNAISRVMKGAGAKDRDV